MKKFTLILFTAFLGVLILSAQKNSSQDKNTPDYSYQQNDKVSDSNVAPKFVLNGKVLTVSNIDNGTAIEIYSALGARVQSAVYNGNPIQLTNLNKGIYIVRVGKFTQKIML